MFNRVRSTAYVGVFPLPDENSFWNESQNDKDGGLRQIWDMYRKSQSFYMLTEDSLRRIEHTNTVKNEDASELRFL